MRSEKNFQKNGQFPVYYIAKYHINCIFWIETKTVLVFLKITAMTFP